MFNLIILSKMKRITRCLPLIIPVCGLVLTLMAGCAHKNAANVSLTILEPGDKVFPIYDYFEVDKQVYVKAHDSYLLSDINSVYATDKFIYTLDASHRLSKIDAASGEIVKQFCQLGRGPHDYIFPIGLTGDDEHLYVLDLMSKDIHIFDFDLTHQRKFSIAQLPVASSIHKTKDGFILFNSIENDSIGKFVITDNEGLITDTFLKLQERLPQTDQPMLMTIYTQELFVPHSNGSIMCFNPDAGDAYLYDGKNLNKLFHVRQDDTFKAMPNNPAPFIRQLFSVNGNILVNCFYNESDYAYYDKDFNLIAYGIGATSDEEVPFSPICQAKDRLITAITTDDTPGAVLPGLSIQAQIIFHRAK